MVSPLAICFTYGLGKIMKRVLAWGIPGVNGNLCQITLYESNARNWRKVGMEVVELVANEYESEEQEPAPIPESNGESKAEVSRQSGEIPHEDVRPDREGSKPDCDGRKSRKRKP